MASEIEIFANLLTSLDVEASSLEEKQRNLQKIN